MARWEDWQRTRHDPDTPPEQYSQALGRKVLGELMEGIKRGGLFQNKIRREFADGTVVIAQFDGTTPMVQVIASASSSEVVNPALTSLWIPRGFVFVPGNADAPQGWGLPVRQQPGDTAWPFGAQNLAPGLEVTRWTAGGPAAQVLLTRDATTDYPDERKQQLPIGYNAQEWRAGMTWQPKAAPWQVVRPTFEGFDWTPNVRGSRIALWNAVTTRLGRELMALPFAGYYDDAQQVASLTATRGMDESQWPTSYQTTAQRATKDGARDAYYEARYANGTPQQLADALAPPAGKFHIDVGVVAGITTATARDAGDWIRCGNVFWHPTDPTLPTLTWDGYPAQNLPLWLVAGGWTGAIGSAVFPLEGWHYEWRGKTRYVYSKNLYAMGRCIGVLPDTVIAAAIRLETVPIDGQPGKTKHVHRVVVITWRADDQFGDADGIAYLWMFRVWCVDFDVTTDVPLHVTDVPVGAYDVSSNPTGWRACGNFQGDAGDLSIGPLGVTGIPWQMWRFNGDGTHAVAAFGSPPYQAESNTWIRELAFQDVGPNALSITPTSSGSGLPGFMRAVDYAADGQLAFVWVQTTSFGSSPPGTMLTPDGSVVGDSYDSVVWWSRGSAPEARSGFFGPSLDFYWQASDLFVLDAATGAFAMLDHWDACSAAHTWMYDVRLCRGGQRVDVSWAPDLSKVREGARESENFLDRINPSFVRDRSGNWMMGYDLGVTKDLGEIYVSTPLCGEPAPVTTGAPTSTHFGSRWISNTGDPATLAHFDADMRAFPLGVV